MSGGEPAWKGLDTSLRPVFIGYDQVERMLSALLPQAIAWRPDAVVGIARGGIVPASMVAGILALPLSFLRHDTAGRSVGWIGEPSAGQRVLLVDDCCSSGTTLRRARAAMLAEGRACLTMVVVHDPDVARYVPDLSHPMRDLFRLPWERGEATPSGRAAKAAGGERPAAAEAPFLGIGLDEALLERPEHAPPMVDPKRTVLLSVLPEAGYPGIAAALRGSAYRDAPIDWPDRAIEADTMARARYKAEAANRFGCTHVVECDAAQAIVIAAHMPHLIVTWWSLDAASGWTIGAAAERGADAPGAVP